MYSGMTKGLGKLGLIGGLLSLNGCCMDLGFPSCDASSPAVAYANGLTQARLGKLYADMEVYSKNPNVTVYGYNFSDMTSVPRDFSDLKVTKVRPKLGTVVVEGCFDHHVLLRFDPLAQQVTGSAVRRPPSQRQIVLVYDEPPIEKVIWSEPSPSDPE
mgnify:CR=1 FL=1